MPLYGCDCYAYALLASGFVDLVIESGLKVQCNFFFNAYDDSQIYYVKLSNEASLCPNIGLQ